MQDVQFGFYSSQIENHQKMLTENSSFPWAMGNVIIRDEKSFLILEDLPVFGVLSELYYKIRKLIQSDDTFVLVSDDVSYNLSIERSDSNLIIKPSWGYYTKNIKIADTDKFVNCLFSACRSAYSFNVLILPMSKMNIQAKSEIELYYGEGNFNAQF